MELKASLQDKIEQLQTGKDAIPHKEAILEEKIKQLLKERDENLQKEASQEEKITQLQTEKNECLQKEHSLEEKIKQMQKDKDAYLQKEVGFEEKISQLENEVAVLNLKGADLERKTKQIEIEKDLWLKKEVYFEGKINQLENEVAVLNLKGVSLDERIKHMEQERDIWVQKQNSTEEAFATLEDDNARLQAEVSELKELRRRSLLQENHLLTENISNLQSEIKKLGSGAAVSDFSLKNNVLISENEDADQADPLAERLIGENATLVGKMSSGTEQMCEKLEVSSSVGYDTTDVVNTLKQTVAANDRWGTDSTSESGKMGLVSRDSIESLEDVIITEPRNGESDEIVQIPLDANQVMGAASAGQNDVTLTEAPLIGAPFRLISFLARYVSGTDLVNKNSGGSLS